MGMLMTENATLSLNMPVTHDVGNSINIIRDNIIVDNNDVFTRLPMLEISHDGRKLSPIRYVDIPPPKKKWMRHYLLEEEPLETNRTNGYSIGSRASPVIASSRGILTGPNSLASGQVTTHHHQLHQQSLQHHNNHTIATHNHYSENSNHTSGGGGSLVVDLDAMHDGKKHRNGPCVMRSGTREVHNKLEKNRRAHLKECFELLKKQLPAQDEKKSSNLSILHAAIRHIQESDGTISEFIYD